MPGKITLLGTRNLMYKVFIVVDQPCKGRLILEHLYELPHSVIIEFSYQVNNPLVKGTESITTTPYRKIFYNMQKYV